jgi:hypothetical protein
MRLRHEKDLKGGEVYKGEVKEMGEKGERCV